MERDEFASRIGNVEGRVEQIGSSLHEMRADIRDLHQLRTDVREIRDSLHKQRGFIAGFSFAFTLLWASVAGIVAWMWGSK